MLLKNLKIWLVAAATVLCGLLPCLQNFLTPPDWEARATIMVTGSAAQALPGVVNDGQFARHIRDLTDFSGTLTTESIPGTALVTLCARDDSYAHAAAGRAAALDRLDALMLWVGECQVEPVLIAEPAALPHTLSVETCLAAALAGGLLAFLVLFPLPKREEPLDLLDLLGRWLRLSRHRWGWLLLLCLLFGGGNYLRERNNFVPTATATILVSMGQYSPDSADTLCSAVYGLLDSHLMTVPGVTCKAVGQTNLFTLTAAAQTPDAAREALTAAMAQWPELAGYAHRDLTLRPRQPMQTTPPQPFRPGAAWGTGCLLGAVFWAAALFLELLVSPQILTPPPPKRIMNPKLKEGSP